MITGNQTIGISLRDNTNPMTVWGNYIGTAADGLSGTGTTTNQPTGISIGQFANASANNVIGGNTITNINYRNVISSNTTRGIYLDRAGSGNQIKGNYIGLAKNGTSLISGGATQDYGIEFANIAPGTGSTTIGGTANGDGNVVSGNDWVGIAINPNSGGNHTLQGNIVGCAASGTTSLNGTQDYGIWIATANNTIGGNLTTTPFARNIISDNVTTGPGTTSAGIYIVGLTANGSRIMGNFIGLAPDMASQITGGTQQQQYGIYCPVAINNFNNTRIGGRAGGATGTPEGNRIAYNTIAGIKLQSASNTDIPISRNLIWNNSGKPIDLSNVANAKSPAVTPYPIPFIISATPTSVTGSANAFDTVEVFSTALTCNDMQIFKGTAIANAAGSWTLSGITVISGETILATATNLGNAAGKSLTSEAACQIVTLPITLLDFNATSIDEGKHVALDWCTASEVNNDYFTIERSSDAYQFDMLNNINGAGNSSSTLCYDDRDENPFKGVSYYRLKQTDYDGKFTYSKTVAVNTADKTSLIISKNIDDGSYRININSSAQEITNTRLEVFNSVGQIIFTEQLTDPAHSYSKEYDFSNYGKGVYLVSVSDYSGRITQRVVVN